MSSLRERLESLLAAGTDSVQLRFGLANACYAEGNFSEAERHAEVAVSRDADYSAAWRLLGQSQVKQRLDDAARRSFQQGIAAAERKGDAQLGREMKVFLRRLERGRE